jgi:hypothetical protein
MALGSACVYIGHYEPAPGLEHPIRFDERSERIVEKRQDTLVEYRVKHAARERQSVGMARGKGCRCLTETALTQEALRSVDPHGREPIFVTQPMHCGTEAASHIQDPVACSHATPIQGPLGEREPTGPNGRACNFSQPGDFV